MRIVFVKHTSEPGKLGSFYTHPAGSPGEGEIMIIKTSEIKSETIQEAIREIEEKYGITGDKAEAIASQIVYTDEDWTDEEEPETEEDRLYVDDEKKKLKGIGNNIAFDGWGTFFQFSDEDYFYEKFHKNNMPYFVHDNRIIGPNPTLNHYDGLGYQQDGSGPTQIINEDDMRFVRDWYKNDYIYDICFFTGDGEITDSITDIFLIFWPEHKSVKGSIRALQMAYKVTNTDISETLNLEKLKILVIQKLLEKLGSFWSGMWVGPNNADESYGNARLSSEKRYIDIDIVDRGNEIVNTISFDTENTHEVPDVFYALTTKKMYLEILSRYIKKELSKYN